MPNDTNTLLLEYWNSRCGDRDVPDRKDIDPVDIPRLLPDIMLVEVQQTGRFRVRLSGTRIVNNLGDDPTGTIFGVDDAHTGLRQFAVNLNRAELERSVQQTVVEDFGSRDLFDNIDVVALPLTRGGDSIDVILIGMCFNVTARDNFRRENASIHS